jgi:hypothetical protein
VVDDDVDDPPDVLIGPAADLPAENAFRLA